MKTRTRLAALSSVLLATTAHAFCTPPSVAGGAGVASKALQAQDGDLPAELGFDTARRSLLRTVVGTAVASAVSASPVPPASALGADQDGIVEQPVPDNPDVLRDGVASILVSSDAAEATKPTDGVVMYKTNSGLKYIELAPSSNPFAATPRYGQLCIVQYAAYIKLPTDREKQKFDEAKGFIIKHGNARMIPGLDEGIHTMKEGSTRRIIIPPKLGYVTSGLGPQPVYPWNRNKLSKLLDEMVEQRGGNIVFDVTLTRVLDDEADQGYYEDTPLSDEELALIQARLGRPLGSDANSD